MYPFIHIGRFSIGTFGILLWLAAVSACWVLYRNFRRWNIDADAIGIVAISTVAGVVGAKLWHVFETPQLLMQDPTGLLLDRAGFAWFGGLIAGILALLWQSRGAGLSRLGMLDLAAPAAAVGYGVGRLGCLISGDGDYGIPTSLPWGMSFPNGLVPTTQRVHPTPIYELIAACVIAWMLWRMGHLQILRGPLERFLPDAKAPGRKVRVPISGGQVTKMMRWLRPGSVFAAYLILTGVARFLVEFIRINPRSFLGMSNAQAASVVSVITGAA